MFGLWAIAAMVLLKVALDRLWDEFLEPLYIKWFE
jgi:hypothetical protein